MSSELEFSLSVVAGAKAFGDGSHPSTMGAMQALRTLAHLQGFERGLDLGCGSGLLALQMAYQWHIPVIASDIEPQAVEATKVNAKANQLEPLVRAIRADGVDHALIRQSAPYDIICCNILAQWLVEHARDIEALMQDESLLILSGVLAQHVDKVIDVYQMVGLKLLQKISVGNWSSFIWQKQL